MTEKRFIEQFEENVRLYPDKVILRDEHTSLTFRELDELSGRVYAYLKEKGIGREDFVMISLSRGVQPVAAAIGVWKAGAALVFMDSNAPIDRKQYVINDCKCKLDIDEKLFIEIQLVNPIESFTQTSDSDAAFAMYTSGSEGKPKGILHEYGKLLYTAHSVSIEGRPLLTKDDIFGHPLPFSSSGGFILLVGALLSGCSIYVLSMNIVLNWTSLMEHIHKLQLTVTGTIPTLIKEREIDAPSLRYFITGAEMSSEIFLKNVPILNFYGQSEVGMTPFTFIIDRPYSNTPIGRPTRVCEALIKDDELCYSYSFTRGYINLPEETARAFRNGLYHTGDIARINEDGNYVILGRKSDMIKINGNRIEPAEIEAAVKKVLNIDWAFAKGFVTPERSYIAVYYTAPIDIDYARTREELLKVLPTYMIPSYFVHLDEVPHLPNGKVDRQALKAPDIEQYRAPYVAPENELEERICKEMANILFSKSTLALSERLGDEGRSGALVHIPTTDTKPSGLSRTPYGCPQGGIGALDDFYLLGGDSLRTIELVTNLDIEDLTVADIYAARTPRAIAARWMQKMIG